VQARFNADITDALAEACLSSSSRWACSASDIHHLQVPGALEVPSRCRRWPSAAATTR
jgi:6,7-dimethyl-8-ribityllumazine synthase